MHDTLGLRETLRIAITCLPLLTPPLLNGCRKPDPELIKSPSDDAGSTTKASAKPSATTIPSVVVTKTTCSAKYHAVVSVADAERLPHSGKTVLGCPAKVDVEAAKVLRLAPEFGDLTGIEIHEDCTKDEQAKDPKACVYQAKILYPPEGRPAFEEGVCVVASVEAGARYRRGPAPSIDGLSAEERAERADRWLAAALAEHASVASFARAMIELMAVGAPPGLIAAAARAAADEVRHAELCFTIASAYAGRDFDPGPMPALTPRGGGLCELVRTTFREGCVAETAAALRAERALAREEDPAVRAALATIARDEVRHAELAWQTVAWALAAGGADVRAALETAAAEVERGDAWDGVIEPSLALLLAAA